MNEKSRAEHPSSSSVDSLPEPPSLRTIEEVRETNYTVLRKTSLLPWDDPRLVPLLAPGARATLKLELLQVTGTFKARGALTVIRQLDQEALARGVTAVSAGNHAVAVAFAASVSGTHATVVMPKTANPARVSLSRSYGATVVLAEDVHAAFAEVERLQQGEGLTFVHPFEGPGTVLGTATLGAEWMEQAPDLEAVIVPIGGGGLMAGVASAIHQISPACRIYGVEPEGADLMSRSFAAGGPVQGPSPSTIADSLAPPFTLPYSTGLCRRFVDAIVTVTDDQLCEAMYLLFQTARLAVEPAGAAAAAALLGPLRETLAGKRVGVLVCGANIDAESFARYLARGERSVKGGAGSRE